MCKVVLMSGNSLVEVFTIGEAAEVEGSAPAVFIEVGSEVIIMPCKGGILCFSRLCKTNCQAVVWSDGGKGQLRL